MIRPHVCIMPCHPTNIAPANNGSPNIDSKKSHFPDTICDPYSPPATPPPNTTKNNSRIQARGSRVDTEATNPAGRSATVAPAGGAGMFV